METGSAQTVLGESKTGKRIAPFTTASASLPGGGMGGDGPDGDLPDLSFNDSASHAPADKSKYIAWFLLMAVGMTFAGLLGAYLMIATNRAAEWRPFDLPIQIWISTAIILASSVTYSFAKRSVDRGSYLLARKWLIATTVLGGLFISSQLVLWIELVNRGFYLRGNPYAGFFYILTAAHLAHVAGGIVALAAIVLHSWHPSRNEDEHLYRRQLARSVGWYWHFMGGLWVVLFLMLGFWK
ncbi:MAG: heme-copper oxidase subunit III [Pyrinomonadaceae bacterium]